VWKKWLGDPLMSMPAIHEGRVLQVYPDSKGDRRHYLAAFELQTGRELWKQPLSGEIITAPVVADGHLYATNPDGTRSCFRADNSEPLWRDQKNATSSPVVSNGQCYYSKRREQNMRLGAADVVQQMEELAMRGRGALGATQSFEGTVCFADYSDH